jgi:hypothetical protein
MTIRYRLECSCGAKVDVEVGQAGERVVCACGATLDVPTMRKLCQLERAAADTEVVQRPWGPRQAVMLLGLAIALLSATVTAGLWLQRPVAPDFHTQAAIRQLDARMKAVTPLQSWVIWKDRLLREGLVEYQTPARVAYREELAANRHAIALALAGAAFGLLIFLAAVLLSPQQQLTG